MTRWRFRQTWHELLFLHWPVSAAALRPLVPAPLSIEEFDGSGWVAVTPFWMSGIGFRNWPAPPVVSRFPELNVRTYVRLDDRPGVWFFSLDAGSRLGAWAGRKLYQLPYQHASMSHHRTGDAIVYRSERPDGAGFAARYGPAGPVRLSRPGTLEHWLTERYCLYARSGSGDLSRAEIQHVPWPLQDADAEVTRNDLLALHRIPASGPPAYRWFAERLEVLIWPPTRAHPTS